MTDFRHDAETLPRDPYAFIPYPADYLREILAEARTIAVLGWSDSAGRPSHSIAHYLKGRGRKVIPVNPGLAGQQALGSVVYASLADIPGTVDMVDVFRRQDALPGVIDEVIAAAREKQIASLWLQSGLRNDDAARKAEAAGLKVVMNRCSMVEMERLSA